VWSGEAVLTHQAIARVIEHIEHNILHRAPVPGLATAQGIG
jgi:hypothetical protein